MYSTTPLSKIDPVIIFPDNKNSTEIKKKYTTTGFKLTSTSKRKIIISSLTVTVAKKPRGLMF